MSDNILQTLQHLVQDVIAPDVRIQSPGGIDTHSSYYGSK